MSRLYVSHYTQKNFATAEELFIWLKKHDFIDTPWTLTERSLYCFKEGWMLFITSEIFAKLSSAFPMEKGTSTEGRKISEFIYNLEH